MSSMKTFQDKSYQQHTEHFKEYTQNGGKAAHAKTWFEKDTVDTWRHQRMYQVLDAILVAEPKAKWLTVGDGRFGNDSKYITEKGCDALATDISEHLLKDAKDIGYINKYKLENEQVWLHISLPLLHSNLSTNFIVLAFYVVKRFFLIVHC